MRLSVIIYTDNSEEVLPSLLDRLSAQEVNEVIVADIGSRDNTIGIARQYGANISRVTSDHPADALNASSQLATCDVLWFLTADSIIPMDASCRILDLMEESHCIGGCFKVRDARMGLINSAGMRLSGIFSSFPRPTTGLFILREVLHGLRGFAKVEHPLWDLLKRASETGNIQEIKETIRIINPSAL